MNEYINEIPLRCSAGDLKTLFFTSRNPFEDLMAFKDRSFESPEDFIQEANKVMSFIKNYDRPWDSPNFYYRSSISFAFVYQKIDGMYRQKSKELQSLSDQEGLDSEKEKEIRSVLRDLLKCELEIENICTDSDRYNPILYEQLETLFDDYELLDLLLLVLSKKIDPVEVTEPLKIKALYFIFPFLKLFYGGKGDLFDFWKNPQDFLKKSEGVEEDLKKLLSDYTDLNENEISRFCEEVKSAWGHRRRLRRIVTREKPRFKEEKGYYEMLGNLSLLLFLWRQEEVGTEVFMPLLRVGLVGYVYFLDGWQNIKIGIGRNRLDRHLRLSSLNLQDRVDLPIQFLKYLVGQKDLDEEDLRLLELSFSAFGCLIKFLKAISYKPIFAKRIEGCVDDCLLTSEGSKSFLMHELYEFLASRTRTLGGMKSNYLIGSSLCENLISGWLSFFKETENWKFIATYSNGIWQCVEKYFSPLKISVHDLIEFLASEEHALPEYLQVNLLHVCSSQDNSLLARSDLEKLFLCAQDIGVVFLQGVRDEKAILRFKTLLKIVHVLGSRTGDLFGDEPQAEDFIKTIYESKLVEGFIAAYEENKLFLQTVGDVNMTEAVWELFGFLAKFSLRDASFIEKERNLDFLKFILQDSCEIDVRLVSHHCYEDFFSGIEALYMKTTFAKYVKEEKLLFGLLRLNVFRPFLIGWQSDHLPETYYQVLSEKRTFLHLFGKWLEVFEHKMRDPSVDLYDALKQFEDRIEDEKRNYKEGEVGAGRDSPYLADKGAPIINDKVSFDSLRNSAGAFCTRVIFWTGKMASQLGLDFKEEVAFLTKRVARMSVDPLLLFGCNQKFIGSLRSGFEDIYYSRKEILISVLEGVFAGIVDICKEFKFNEYSVISKLDAKRVSKMVAKIALIHYLMKEDIPEDITYQEAALMSLLVGVVNFNRYLQSCDETTCKEIEKLEAQLKEVTVLIDQVKSNVLKCFSLEIVKESGDARALAKECKVIFEGPNCYLNLWNEIFNVFYRMEKLKIPTEEVYKTRFQSFDLEFRSPTAQENEESVLAGIVYNTLRLKELSLAFYNVDQGLWISLIISPDGLKFMLECELYLMECANHYCDPKTKDLIVTLADILEACFKRGDVSSKKEFINQPLLQVIIDFLTKFAKSPIPERNCRRLMKKNLDAVFAFFEQVYRSYFTFVKEKRGQIDENEKVALVESYKNEIQRYIDGMRYCQQHHLVNFKELFVLGEGFGSVIPHDYWIKFSEQSRGNLASHVNNLLQGADNVEKPSKDVSKYKAVNQVYQLDFLYQCLEQLFIKEIVNELSLDKGLIEGLLMATKKTLKSLVSEDLTLLAKERECLDFPETLGGFISRASKIAINYIVSFALENNCQFNENNGFLLMSLDLAENILDVQKVILSGLRRDIFSGSNNCYRPLVCLVNTILRANKILRVEFLNRNLLGRLLTVERLGGFKIDEITAILFLMTALLEDSLELDSQVALALENVMKDRKTSEISLKDLMQDKNFKHLRNYKQVLEILKVYGIKANKDNAKAEEDFSLLLPKDSNDNLQKNLSPVAEECLKILVNSLMENYAFEKESIASLAKVKEQRESRQIKQLSKRGILPRGYLLVDQIYEQEDESCDEPHVYLNDDLNREMIVKETSSLVVILSGVLYNYPRLIPAAVLREVPLDDILRNDPEIMNFFKANSKWSAYDILLRLILLKDGSSAVFLIASLIQSNTELKYTLLFRTFEV